MKRIVKLFSNTDSGLMTSYLRGTDTLDFHRKLNTSVFRLEGSANWKDVLKQAPFLKQWKDLRYVDLSSNQIDDEEALTFLPSFVKAADPPIVDLSNNLVSGFGDFYRCLKKLITYKTAYPHGRFQVVILLENPIVTNMKPLLTRLPKAAEFLVWVPKHQLDSYPWSEVIDSDQFVMEAKRVHKMYWSGSI